MQSLHARHRNAWLGATRRMLLLATLFRVVAPVGVLAGAPRPAETLRAVQSDPHFAAWVAALAARDAGAANVAANGAPACGTVEGLEARVLETHRCRAALLASLTAQGIRPSAPPAGAAPWPWGPGVSEAGSPTTAAVRDTAGVSVLQDHGDIVFTNREGEVEVDPVLAANAFYAAHNDEYDFLVLFTTFPSRLAGSNFLAYHLAIANDVTGLGYTHLRANELFDDSAGWTHKTGPGRLQSFVHLNSIDAFPADPNARYTNLYTPVELLGHEMGHRWLTRVRIDIPGIGRSNVLLGRQLTHWSFILDAFGSPLEGNRWLTADNVYFTSAAMPIAYSPLDLYLMGFASPGEVDPAALFYVSDIDSIAPPTDPSGNSWTTGSTPTAGVTLHGRRREFTIDDIALTNGYRIPAAADSRHDFRVAFALVTLPGFTARPDRIAKIAAIRDAFAGWFHDKTLGRGTVDGQVTSVPARLVFVHHPHGDFESATNPIPVATHVDLEQWSVPTRLEDVQVAFYWSEDGGPFAAAPVVSPALGDFAAEIPAQPFGTTIRYWFRATSNFPGHEQRWPVTADSAFQFQITPDTQAPTVQHVARSQWSRLAEPPLMRAFVRDRHGVANVRIDYRIAGGALQSAPLLRQGASDLWELRFALPGRIGDTVEYRIVARDVSTIAHETSSPAAGFYALQVRRELVEDAENEDPMWTHRSLVYGGADQWHRDDIVNPIQGLRSWKMGPTNSLVPHHAASPQNSVLESPATRVYPGGSLRMTHRYFLLRDEFTQNEAWDVAIVEWQDVDRDGPHDKWFLIDPDRGYPFLDVSYDADSPFHGYPSFSGVRTFAATDTFTLPPWIWNRNVRFRFHVALAPDGRRPALDGWTIDDIHLDAGPPTTAIALTDLTAQWTPGGIALAWQAHDIEPGDSFAVSRAALDPRGTLGVYTTLAAFDVASNRGNYTYVDGGAPEGVELVYRVALRSHGVETAAAEVRVGAAPRFALLPNTPNPFNPTTRLRFDLPHHGRARLDVYDVRGRCVRTLVDAVLEAGSHTAVWDGTDASGRAVASGIYIARLTSGAHRQQRRMALVR